MNPAAIARIFRAWPLMVLVAGVPLLLGGWVVASSARGGAFPAQGGSYVEGLVGPAPQLINPLFAAAEGPEHDLTALVFAGLTRPGPQGEPEPDLAESWVSSTDGTAFTFDLRHDAYWQDGVPITSDDVLFTAQAYSAPGVRGDPSTAEVWRRAHVQKIGAYAVVFQFDSPFEPFLAYSAAGILPQHLLGKDTAQQLVTDSFNQHPIGAGPYRLTSLTSTEARLVPNVRYQLGAPYLAHLTLRFLASTGALEQALNLGSVSGGILPPPVEPAELDRLRAGSHTLLGGLRPVYTLVYLNLDLAQFQDPLVRRALSLAIDRQALVQQVMFGQATSSDVPLAPGTWSGDAEPLTVDLTGARALLQQAGWKPDANGILARGGIEMTFSLQTTADPQRLAAAQAVAAAWRSLGIDAQVSSMPDDALLNTVLLPHKYEAVLYGWDPGPDPDPFPAWHSSQTGQTGGNLSDYSSARADQLLEVARQTPDTNDRAAIYGAFAGVFRQDMPAIILFFPRYLYVVPSDLQGVSLGLLSTTGARFNTIQRWSIKTSRT